MKLALLALAALLSVIDLVRSRGAALTSWATLALAAYLYL